MKKSLILFGCLLVILCGCSQKNNESKKDDNLVVCSSKYEDEYVSFTTKINTLFEDDVISDVTAVFEFSDEDTMKEYCQYFEMINSDDEKLLNIDCSGNDITLDDYKKLLEIDKDLIDTINKEDYISKMEESGYNCEK